MTMSSSLMTEVCSTFLREEIVMTHESPFDNNNVTPTATTLTTSITTTTSTTRTPSTDPLHPEGIDGEEDSCASSSCSSSEPMMDDDRRPNSSPESFPPESQEDTLDPEEDEVEEGEREDQGQDLETEEDEEAGNVLVIAEEEVICFHEDDMEVDCIAVREEEVVMVSDSSTESSPSDSPQSSNRQGDEPNSPEIIIILPQPSTTPSTPPTASPLNLKPSSTSSSCPPVPSTPHLSTSTTAKAVQTPTSSSIVPSKESHISCHIMSQSPSSSSPSLPLGKASITTTQPTPSSTAFPSLSPPNSPSSDHQKIIIAISPGRPVASSSSSSLSTLLLPPPPPSSNLPPSPPASTEGSSCCEGSDSLFTDHKHCVCDLKHLTSEDCCTIIQPKTGSSSSSPDIIVDGDDLTNSMVEEVVIMNEDTSCPMTPIDSFTAPCKESVCRWTHCDWPGVTDDLSDHILSLHVKLQPYHSHPPSWRDRNRGGGSCASSIISTSSCEVSESSPMPSPLMTDGPGQVTGPQFVEHTFVCLWDGCKQYGLKVKSRTWLEKHYLTHCGDKPHKCIIDQCGARFKTEGGLMKHINVHFNGHHPIQASDPNDTEQEGDGPDALKHKRRLDGSTSGSPYKGTKSKKKNKTRRIRLPKASMDMMDRGTMMVLNYRIRSQSSLTPELVMDRNPFYPSRECDKIVTFISEVVLERVSERKDEENQVFIYWIPGGFIPNQWVKKSQLASFEKKQVSLRSLSHQHQNDPLIQAATTISPSPSNVKVPLTVSTPISPHNTRSSSSPKLRATRSSTSPSVRTSPYKCSPKAKSTCAPSPHHQQQPHHQQPVPPTGSSRRKSRL